MAYTTADLDSVKAAIVNLATGARVVQVVIDGKEIRYSDVELEKLQALESIIAGSVGSLTLRTYAKRGGGRP